MLPCLVFHFVLQPTHFVWLEDRWLELFLPLSLLKLSIKIFFELLAYVAHQYLFKIWFFFLPLNHFMALHRGDMRINKFCMHGNIWNTWCCWIDLMFQKSLKCFVICNSQLVVSNDLILVQKVAFRTNEFM